VRGSGEAGERRKLCLHAEDLAIVAAETAASTAAICGLVVASTYQGAATLVTIHPNVPNAPLLKVAQAGEPPSLGAPIAVAVRDGWLIPGRSIP
jgi:hypothetical protein